MSRVHGLFLSTLATQLSTSPRTLLRPSRLAPHPPTGAPVLPVNHHIRNHVAYRYYAWHAQGEPQSSCCRSAIQQQPLQHPTTRTRHPCFTCRTKRSRRLDSQRQPGKDVEARRGWWSIITCICLSCAHQSIGNPAQDRNRLEQEEDPRKSCTTVKESPPGYRPCPQAKPCPSDQAVHDRRRSCPAHGSEEGRLCPGHG